MMFYPKTVVNSYETGNEWLYHEGKAGLICCSGAQIKHCSSVFSVIDTQTSDRSEHPITNSLCAYYVS